VLVPPAPGVLCAMGVLVNDLQTDSSRTHVIAETAGGCAAAADRIFAELEARASDLFASQRTSEAGALTFQRAVDARYVGQNHELSVAAPGGAFDTKALATVKENFHAAHREMYGYASLDKPLELVTCRVRARLCVARREAAGSSAPVRTAALQPIASRKVYFEQAQGFVDCPVYLRDDLRALDRLTGPAIIEQMDCTTVVPPQWSVNVDGGLNLLLRNG
jgi:N-methylhydantoinase A